MSENPFQSLFEELEDGEENLSKSEFARRYFLNPQVPLAVKNDLDGLFHFNLGVSDEEGDPIEGLKKDDTIPLALRWYQCEMIDDPSRFRVYRCGRRIGKSFVLGCEAVIEALTNSNAKILILAPNESHIKILFDEYIRPLLATYRHRKSGKIGIPRDLAGNVPNGCDFVIVRDTQKPQELVITDGQHHRVSIRGMVVSNAARGQSANLLIFDEADYADAEAVRGIVLPIINTRPDTKIVMSSTPTGRRDSFYYEANHDSSWSLHHHTYEVLPHFDEDLRAQTIKLAGGETSPTYVQEYMAHFGSLTSGVFDQVALNKAMYVAPYCSVLESINPTTKQRSPLLSDIRTDPTNKTKAYYEAVQPVDWPISVSDPLQKLGSESVYRPEFRGYGVITAGTDWNTVAGMQTVIVWWPPEEWLRQGKIKISRFTYNGDDPITTKRAKDENGRPLEYAVGLDNGDPGGAHDLSQVKGIVIWHGRLEGGDFSWLSAANRVAGIMSIPDFINAWYVDFGYGEQVNQMIEGIMTSGQYIADDHLLSKAKDIDERLMKNIRRFHPEQDPEYTQRLYRTVQFAKPYKHRDIDFSKRGDLYKDVMVGLSRKMVSGREILLPYGELVGFHREGALGDYYDEEFDYTSGDLIEVPTRERDRDIIEETGAAPSRGERDFGGLLTQMRGWRVEGYSPAGRPRYSGHDHAIDGLMLALLAYWENYSDEAAGNMFRKPATLETAIAEDILDASQEASSLINKPIDKPKTRIEGNFRTKDYKSERGALDAIRRGASPEEAGTSLADMIEMAAKHIKKFGF